MNKEELDINLIKKYVYNDNSVSTEDKMLFVSLFNFYRKANRLNSLESIKNELNNYEYKIYNIDNKKMTEEEKIRLEIERIKRAKVTNPEVKHTVDETIKEIEELLNNKLYFSDSILQYIKKKIVELQILLKLDITFLQSAYDLFLEKYNNLKISEYNIRSK